MSKRRELVAGRQTLARDSDRHIENLRKCSCKSIKYKNEIDILFVPFSLISSSPRGSNDSEESISEKVRLSVVALEIISKIEFYEFIESTIRTIVLFRDEKKNSFFHPDFPTMIFVNCDSKDDEFHFVEEIIHQSGHAAIYALSKDCERFVNSEVSFKLGNVRDRYHEDGLAASVRFHSLVTLSLVAEAMFKIVTNSGPEKHLLGRMLFAIKKLYFDIGDFHTNYKILCDEGIFIFRDILKLYKIIISKYYFCINEQKFDGQGYVFDKKIFIAEN